MDPATLRRCASQRPESERRSQAHVHDANVARTTAVVRDGRSAPSRSGTPNDRVPAFHSAAGRTRRGSRNASASCLHCDPSPDVNVRALAPVVLTLPHDGPPSRLWNTDTLNRQRRSRLSLPRDDPRQHLRDLATPRYNSKGLSLLNHSKARSLIARADSVGVPFPDLCPTTPRRASAARARAASANLSRRHAPKPR